VAPLRIFFTSASDGGLTFITTSASAYTSSTSVAPASANSLSVKLAFVPAPFCTCTTQPFFTHFCTFCGVMPTRVSLSGSVGTPILSPFHGFGFGTGIDEAAAAAVALKRAAATMAGAAPTNAGDTAIRFKMAGCAKLRPAMG